MEFSTRAEHHADTTVSEATAHIKLFLSSPEHVDAIIRTLCMYIRRANLATGDAVQGEALEVLSEVVIEALKNAERFDPSRQVRPWLLGIATNIIKRRQLAQWKRMSKETCLRNVYPDSSDISDDELFDRLIVLCTTELEIDVIANEQVTAMLSLVSSDDQHILRLAILHGLSGEALAEELGIKHGAARVRLHRALDRLRTALQQRATSEQEGETYE